MEIEALENLDLSLDNGNVVAECRFSPRPFWQKFRQSGPRLSMLQISKERYVRVQLTEIYEMRPEPKKGHILLTIEAVR